eukprot:s5618_g1.t1
MDVVSLSWVMVPLDYVFSEVKFHQRVFFGSVEKGNAHAPQPGDPCKVCASAAKQVTELAGEYFASVPRVEISFHGSEKARKLPLIPHYLFYIVAELLKNSFRAVAETHLASGAAGNPEPLQIRVACDEAQVALLIMDRGGGIPFERQPHVWSYMYSTARGNQICQETGHMLDQVW